MIIGRLLGSFIAVVLADIILNNQDIFIRIVVWLLAANIGTFIGIFLSYHLKMMAYEDISLPQDSLDYWELVYPNDPETAKMAHKMWMEER